MVNRRHRPRSSILAAVLAAMAIELLFAAVARAQSLDDGAAERVLSAVVGVAARVPADARTAQTLGTARTGSGVVIGSDGLVLTIGYLMLEAEHVAVITGDDELVPATIVAYDAESGFGLLRAERPLGVRPIRLGSSAALATGQPVLSISYQLGYRMTSAVVTSRRQFAGYWEYLLDDAVYTAPPHRQFAGAALIAIDGTLVGIGSLYVADAADGGRPQPGNLFVPIDALKPILADLLTDGRRGSPPTPWLGLYAGEASGRVFVTRTADGGPAARAGLRPGDMIIAVAGEHVAGLADFLAKVRSLGAAGTAVPIDVVSRETGQPLLRQVVVQSADRYQWLKLKTGG
ncbi:MAG: S1C family serine protease [Rhodospirillales bacterium]